VVRSHRDPLAPQASLRASTGDPRCELPPPSCPMSYALKGEPLARETASKTDETILSWQTPHERFFSSLVFSTVAHSALISLAGPPLMAWV